MRVLFLILGLFLGIIMGIAIGIGVGSVVFRDSSSMNTTIVYVDNSTSTSTSTSTTESTTNPVLSVPTVQACPYSGKITYAIRKASNPTHEETLVYAAITVAMNEAIKYVIYTNSPQAGYVFVFEKAIFSNLRFDRYYECYTSLTVSDLIVLYDPNVTSANANYAGPITFGGDRDFITTRVALHELSHVAGIGTVRHWVAPTFVSTNSDGNGVWLGPTAIAEMNRLTAVIGGTDLYIKDYLGWFASDVPYSKDSLYVLGPHFAPFGLLYDYEVTSPQVYVAHCFMVQALITDMGLGFAPIYYDGTRRSIV